MYMHCGAIRKVLLAWQTPTFIDEYFRTIIIHDQAFPHVRPDDLREELKKIRQDGYAITAENMSPMPVGSVHRSSTLKASLQVPSALLPRRSGSALRNFLRLREILSSFMHLLSPPTSDTRSTMYFNSHF